MISTRTPHAGSDQPLRSDADLVHISTRTPHAGSDHARHVVLRGLVLISTRTPHAGSDRAGARIRGQPGRISTRTPHAGSDITAKFKATMNIFQPALPMRGVTVFAPVLRVDIGISTRTPHAGSDVYRADRLALGFLISTRTPHAGSDAALSSLQIKCIHFNPHSPCGE